jgi:hypothetical protein
LLPLGLDFLIKLGDAEPGARASLAEVIGRGELCLIVTALSAVGLGEIGGAKLKGEKTGILLVGASLLNIALGIAVYVLMKSHESGHPPGMYISLSYMLFISTAIVATSCVAVSEVRDA